MQRKVKDIVSKPYEANEYICKMNEIKTALKNKLYANKDVFQENKNVLFNYKE
jgi:hypothetical protein